MSKPRNQQICLSETPYYHCVSRCVRQAFLCGADVHSKKSYKHRRALVEQRLLMLTATFAIDVCAYAIMSNHSHVVVKINKAKAQHWNLKQVLNRWHKLHYGTYLTRRYCKDEQLNTLEEKAVIEFAEKCRNRLYSLSWFMRELNEFVARRANEEDGCTGRFWEGKFKSQPLLDMPALISCMVYVDLNPVRACMAKSLSDSDHTSIQQRLISSLKSKQPVELLPFADNVANERSNNSSQVISFKLKDYLTLVEQTGRSIRNDKAGFINSEQISCLSTLNIAENNWLDLTSNFETLFRSAVGAVEKLSNYCKTQGIQRRYNLKNSQKLFSSAKIK
ncbi:transposase [Colwelliaceae bacterium BS250]